MKISVKEYVLLGNKNHIIRLIFVSLYDSMGCKIVGKKLLIPY